jgi:hypothetical protein
LLAHREKERIKADVKRLKDARFLSIQVSISPKFYEQLFRTKVFCTVFLYLQLGFVISLQKFIGKKAVSKMLAKLTTGPPTV